MPRFLAIYNLRPEDLAGFRAMPKAEQDRIDNLGLPLWEEWENRHGASLVDRGGMVGKTLRVNRDGTVAPATNTICGYLVVEAQTIEAAAKVFEGHPHLTHFPGHSVDIMPLLT